MGTGGGASGSQLASSIAGGWPLPVGPRLAIPYGGCRGLSAEGQGDWGCGGASELVLGSTVDTSSSSRRTVDGASFSSSTEWWILPLCYRDRYAQCQTVQGRRQPCHGAEDVSVGPVQQTIVIPQLQSIDTVFDVPLVQVQQILVCRL